MFYLKMFQDDIFISYMFIVRIKHVHIVEPKSDNIILCYMMQKANNIFGKDKNEKCPTVTFDVNAKK